MSGRAPARALRKTSLRRLRLRCFYLMEEPSGTLGSAKHSPAAHVSFFPSYVAIPPTTFSFSFTASQNLLLHSEA
jgi:hypothetical protein